MLAEVDGMLVPIPINLDTVNRLYGLTSPPRSWRLVAARAEPSARSGPRRTWWSQVGRELYEKFFRGYTRKQWGLDPVRARQVSDLAGADRTDRDDRYFTDAFQFMPKHGFTRMFEKMVDHPNINIMPQTDYRDVVKDVVPHRRVIYTGPIDEYFDFRSASCPTARSLRACHARQGLAPAGGRGELPADERAYTRVTEYKHLTGQEHAKTALTYEYPSAEGDPYYPVPTPRTRSSSRSTSASPSRPRRVVRRAVSPPTATTTWTRSSAGARDLPAHQRGVPVEPTSCARACGISAALACANRQASARATMMFSEDDPGGQDR